LRYRQEITSNVSNARRAWNSKSSFFAFVESEDGQLGVGEGWTSYGSPAALKATVEDEIAPLVAGKSAFQHREVVERVRRGAELSNRFGTAAAAVSAVETAMWDLIGKKLGQPLYRLLGAAGSDRVKVYASGGLYGPNKSRDDLGKEMVGYVAMGFDTVKMKVGGVPLLEDVARVAAAREAIGPTIKLIVDVHYVWDAVATVRFARAIEKYDITWIEAPIPPLDFQAYRIASAQSPIPLAGCETVAWADTFQQYVEGNGLHYMMFDPSACGGIGESRRIADVAYNSGRPCTLHSSSSLVLFAADLHIAASVPNCHSVEYHMLHQWFWNRGPESDWRRIEKGTIKVPSSPGLGIDLTPEHLKKS
jgi:L-alanine-DL-glutamate epimerase-like enolase superfamily enzyme